MCQSTVLGPDLGVAPLSGLVAEAIGRAYPVGTKLPSDDDDAFAAVILAWAFAALLIGVALTSLVAAAAPAVRGLHPVPGHLRSTGLNRRRVGGGGDRAGRAERGAGRRIRCPLAVAALLAAVDARCEVNDVAPELRFGAVVILPTAVFHVVAWETHTGLNHYWLLGHGRDAVGP